MNSLLLTDGYKTGHHKQYPKGTSLVYSNFTPRSNRHAPAGINKVVSFGQQYVIKWIVEHFEKNFFSRPKDEVVGEMEEILTQYLGAPYDGSHFDELHDNGFLPVEVKAIPEGTLVPIGVPVLTIYNTDPRFYWVTNYLETIISTMLWKPITSATLALEYKKILTKWAKKTDENQLGFVEFQAHDFSMRGLSGLDSVLASGMGHGVVFSGSDSLPSISGFKDYYGSKGFTLGSVNATEHSVMCAGSKDDEIQTFRNLLDTYPTGILSVVSDTWDLWKVITEYLPQLKEEIMARDGKLVIRPDSGDPVDIICGKWPYKTTHDTPEEKGVIELLWEIFGGTINEQGYKVLDPHIGAIYGDSITIERAEGICQRLAYKGFASTNIVLGVGSFTYQYNTRDTFGFAMKATYVEIIEDDSRGDLDTIRRPIFKDPVTDDGVKKSAKGLLHVTKDMVLLDDVSWNDEDEGVLESIFIDGLFPRQQTRDEIKSRIDESL